MIAATLIMLLDAIQESDLEPRYFNGRKDYRLQITKDLPIESVTALRTRVRACNWREIAGCCPRGAMFYLLMSYDALRYLCYDITLDRMLKY